MKSIWFKDYAMVFWADEAREPVDTVLQVNDFLRQYGEDYVLRYLIDQVEIAMDRQSLTERCDPNRRKDELLTQSYFSHNRIWFSLSTGRTEYTRRVAPQMMPAIETLKFEFDLEHLRGPDAAFSFNRLKELFGYCIRLFVPFYAFNSKNGEINDSPEYHRLWKSIDVNKVPIAIEWFNYFGPDWVERFGSLEKLLAAPVFLAEPVEELGGAILILQEEPFDYTNPDHLQNRRRVEDYLELPRLHQLFQKS